MQTENDTSKPEDSPEQETGEGCSGATCSLIALAVKWIDLNDLEPITDYSGFLEWSEKAGYSTCNGNIQLALQEAYYAGVASKKHQCHEKNTDQQ